MGKISAQTLLLCVGGLLLGCVGGYFVGKSSSVNPASNSLSPIEEKGTSYMFVRPLLGYRVPEATVFGEYVDLKNSFQTIVDAQLKSNAVSRISLYFRDLDAGQWVGINQDQTYYPASLLKVPVMIAYYKQAEENSALFEDRISYSPSVLPQVQFDAPSTLEPSHEYSIAELIRRMIVDSDNGATFTLLDHINPDLLNATYLALGIPNPGDDSAAYQISTRAYGLFFRILYNATYLSSGYSERALKLLSETTYTNGLVAGVPQGTLVAHKFGEHVFSENGTPSGIELSDCGIIYYPAHPYLLCVMTSSRDVSSAETSIAAVSRTAYAAVAARYPVSQ